MENDNKIVAKNTAIRKIQASKEKGKRSSAIDPTGFKGGTNRIVLST